MEGVYSAMLEALRGEERFYSPQGILLKNKVIEAANQNDVSLLRLLLKNPVLKKAFFTQVDEIQVFDKTGFGWMLTNREFLPDSYTRFKNKIGLTTTSGEFLSSSSRVVLSFPYKDCVLEGGQSREEQGRRERFYNATLVPEEVDRLLWPKALTGGMRYTAGGAVEIEKLEGEENLLIKGNNLMVLSSLRPRFGNRIRMAYWDIPYNTGSDSFRYNDKFSRSTWLVFMKNRVEQVLPLLDPVNGVLLIQCSFHNYAYLKVLLDEIVGNYVLTFHVLVRHPDRTLTADKEYNDVIEYVLVYSRSPSFRMPRIEEEKTVDEYQWRVVELKEGRELSFDGRGARVFLPQEYELVKEEPGRDKLKVMSVRGSIKEKVSSGRFYVKYLQPLEGKYPPRTLFKVDNIGDDQFPYRYFYLPSKGKKNGTYLQGMPISTTVTYKPYPNFVDFVHSYNRVNDEGSVEFRNGKKPEELVAYFMEIFTRKGDYLLDVFAGSGTSGAVALKGGRRFILCEQMDYVKATTRERLLGVLNGQEMDGGQSSPCQEGESFVYCELLGQNMKYVEALEKVKDGQGLWELLEEVLKTGYISSQVSIQDLKSHRQEFEELSFEEKKTFVLDLLDKNVLYVSMDEIEDGEQGVSERDKAFSRSFYQVEAKDVFI